MPRELPIQQTETHVRETTCTIPWIHLQEIIQKAVAEQAGITPPLHPDKNCKIEITQLSEGSPSYPVSKWSAQVTITENLRDLTR